MKAIYIIRLNIIMLMVVLLCIPIPSSSAQDSSLLSDVIIERVSVSSDGTEGNSWSQGSTISANGRYVAFASTADNLVIGDTNQQCDIFVHDRQNHTTMRVSVSSDGTQGNGSSCASYISANGYYVAFESYATNLVVGDTNNASDIFVHDLNTGETTRVSINSHGMQGSGFSYSPFISSDGRYVGFTSEASLVPDDTNGYIDAYMHDRSTGYTTRISIASDGSQGNSHSGGNLLSADGRYGVFVSEATNLVEGDNNQARDIFVHDQNNGETIRVSVSSDGSQANASSQAPFISANGRYVGFSSDATNLVNGDTNGSADVFIHDLITGETNRISVNSSGTQGNGSSNSPKISSDGRLVVFWSDASNLVDVDTNGWEDVFVHNCVTGMTQLISLASDGTQGNDGSDNGFISFTGRFVSFRSRASNLVLGDTNGVQDIFVHDRGILLPQFFLPIIKH